jgi:signal peptidase I
MSRKHGVRFWFLIALLGITTVLGYLSQHFFAFIVVSGKSMEPTLKSGETIWIRKDCPNYYVGDIVVADIVEDGDMVRVIKRVIARYPATISISNSVILVDGKEVIDISYYPKDFTFEMKADQYLIFGDNSKISDYYFINKEQIIGRILTE